MEEKTAKLFADAVSLESARKDALSVLGAKLGLDASLCQRYAAVLLRVLLQLSDGDEEEKKKPDYSKPGKMGELNPPNLIWIWAGPGPDEGWKKLVIEKPESDCEGLVIEADYFEAADPCPPKDGFASIVKEALRKAWDTAEGLECPDDCPGTTFVDTVYKEWHCENGKAMVTVQVCRLCNVI